MTVNERIEALRRERKAVILAHYYTPGEVQDVADYVGDSLGLAQTAAQTEAEVIVFAGVHFMAETAAILCPEKTVLSPDVEAGCPMADMITREALAAKRAEHPGAQVVAYVNTSAATKTLSDVCCTSSNALAVVRSIPATTPILFVPDQNLGHWIMTETGREMLLWPGFCPTHQRLLPEHLLAAKAAEPTAQVAVHPECRPAVVAMADYVGSTTGIVNYCQKTKAEAFIIGTEAGVLHPIRRDNPGKRFSLAGPTLECPNMKKNSLEKILWCLEEMAPVVRIPVEVAAAARRPIERMLEIT